MRVTSIAIVVVLLVCGLFVFILHYYGNVFLDEARQILPLSLMKTVKQNFLILDKRRFVNEIVTERDADLRAAVERIVHNGTKPGDPDLVKLVSDIMDKPGDNPLPKIHVSQVRRTPQGDTVDKILKSKHDGFFIESGAYDGELATNTIFLERSRNWTGLLVEMDPYFYTMLRSKNRRTYCLNACVSPRQHPMQISFTESDGQGGQLNTNTVGRVKPNPHIAKSRHNVSCFPLETMLLALNRTHVDYWSLDVEGLDLDVLQTVPFDRLNISIISVEHIHVPQGKQAVRTYMESQGYTMYKDIKLVRANIGLFVNDFIFVRNDLIPSKIN